MTAHAFPRSPQSAQQQAEAILRRPAASVTAGHKPTGLRKAVRIMGNAVRIFVPVVTKPLKYGAVGAVAAVGIGAVMSYPNVNFQNASLFATLAAGPVLGISMTIGQLRGLLLSVVRFQDFMKSPTAEFSDLSAKRSQRQAKSGGPRNYGPPKL